MAYEWLKAGTGALGAGILGKALLGNDDNSYLDQIPGVLDKSYGGYMGRGERAGGILEDEFGNMTQDPEGRINKLMQNYRSTPGFQQKLRGALDAAGNTAAAGGRVGTIGDIKNQAGIENQLLGQDMQQWLDNVLGVKRTGLAGEQGLYGAGLGATQAYTGDMTNYYGQKERGRLADRKENMELLMNAIKAAASAYTGGLGGVGGGSGVGGGF